MSQIYVVGHRNPDNDSIMAAYTFAHLKDLTDPDNEYLPVRLGPLPAESEMIFGEYGLEAPALIEKVKEGDRVILVDHNELGQAVEGIEKAEIMGVVDHHRIADVSTASPIFFLNLPLGSTATIIAKLYEHAGISIEDSIAACLLSAMLSDTVILKSPTATAVDQELVEKLSQQIGVDPTEFGMKIFRSRGGDEDVSLQDICNRDSKEFNIGGKKVWIAQYETVDLESMRPRLADIAEEVANIQDAGDYYAALLMVTDIIVEGSEFVAAGDLGFLGDAFGIDLTKGTVWMPGILSRKKQVASVLVDYAG